MLEIRLDNVESVGKSYTAFHQRECPRHVYPTEWVIRTLLGKYPNLCLDTSSYPGSSILDLGFGDGRNWPLLHNCGFNIYGVEITDKIVDLGRQRLKSLGIPAVLVTGRNTQIPFADKYFNYILACHSCYYIDNGATFEDVCSECARVVKPGGYFIASLPEIGGQICENGVDLGNGHLRITHDPWGLRNGYVFRVFRSREEIEKTFSRYFEITAIGLCQEDFYGVYISFYIVVARRTSVEIIGRSVGS